MPGDKLPSFFFSYARADADKDTSPTLQKFFNDLQNNLETRAHNNLPADRRLGIHDQRVQQGTDWDTDLSGGLKSNKGLVAITTPIYFSRENCGKEIAVFARRHPNTRLDSDGSLRDTTNILPIRWYDDTYYEQNGAKDGAVPVVLRKITWVPAKNGDQARAKAIERYRTKGMKRCVKHKRDYYEELLNAFAERISKMPVLPEASFSVTWNDIVSAFTPGWSQVPRDAGPPGAGAAALVGQAQNSIPSGPADVAVFYVTMHKLILDTRAVEFADKVVDVLNCQAPRPNTAPYLDVVQAVQQACQLERFNDYHCACDPQVPGVAAGLIDRLAALSDKNVIVVLAVDPSLWLGSAPPGGWPNVIEEVARSNRWNGPIVLPIVSAGEAALNFAALLARTDLSRTVAVLSGDRQKMPDELRSVLLAERGRMMRTGKFGNLSDGERPPLLQGPGGPSQK